MGTRFRFLAAMVLPVSLLCLSACNNSSSSSSSGTGVLYVASQGDSSVSTFSIDLTKGLLTAGGTGVATGSVPTAMLLAPSGTALFIANSGTNDISAYSVKSDGSLTAAGATQPAGMTPLSMAMDSGGKFLFVANQGLQIDPNSGTVSVFAVSGTTLAEVPGSPFRVAVPGAPVAPALRTGGHPRWKTPLLSQPIRQHPNQILVDGSGVLTLGPVVPVGTTPSAVGMTPDGGLLYVGNASTVSAFAICNQVLTSCNDPTSPDGSLTAVAGSPFSAGIGPVAIVASPSGKLGFVVNRLSNQISEYKIATGTGVLTPYTQSQISTGANPVGATIRAGTATVAATGGTTDFLYVPNLGASSVSVYSFDSTVGTLGLVGGPVPITGGQPSAVAAE